MLWLGDCNTVLRGMPQACVDSVVTDPPYAITAARGVLEAWRDATASGACRRCGTVPAAPGFTACSICLDEILAQAIQSAAMLVQQSPNWHEQASDSRGYADNDNTSSNAGVCCV